MVLGRGADRLVDALQREVGEAVGAELVGDLLDRALVGDHLLAGRHVDPVVAGVADRRRRDPQVDLLGAGVAQDADDLPGRVAAHDRVVDDDDALPGDDLRQRVELEPQPPLAQLLAGLDEGPRDVAVLDQAVVAGQPRGAREAARGRVARVGNGDHQVGLDRGLLPEDFAHPPADLLQDLALEAAVGSREVDVLEDAVGRPPRLDHLAGLQARARSARPSRRGAPRAAARRRRCRRRSSRRRRRSGRRGARARAAARRAGRGRRRSRAWSSPRSSRRLRGAASRR